MRVMRLLWRFVRTYTLFSLALLTIGIAGGLTVVKYGILANGILTIFAAISLIPLIVRIVQELRSGHYGTDILGLIAVGTAIVLRQPWAALVLVVVLGGSRLLQDAATFMAQRELRTLHEQAPRQAHIIHKGKTADLAVRNIREGNTLVVRPGEIIPSDGIILNGTTAVDESKLTGEKLPQPRAANDQVLCGSVNIDNEITMLATCDAGDNQYQQIVRLATAAAEHQAPFAQLADRYSLLFMVIALTIAGCAWVLSHRAIQFLDVLVVATPCSLALATPVALVAGMSRAARDGIIIKTGAALELLAQAKTFAFGKSGILTQGTPAYAATTVLSPFRKQDVLLYAAAAGQHSSHVLATAIRQAAQQQKLVLPKVKHVHETAGHGVVARIKNVDVLVGNLTFVVEHGAAQPTHFDEQGVAQTVTYVAIDGKLAGYITFVDAARPEAKPAIKLLQKLGRVKTTILTGDNRRAAEALAKELGITSVIAEALPGDRVREIETIADKPVAFVGDGRQDAPVLMAADVGIALGARGDTTASESANVIIMRNDLRLVTHAVAISKRSLHIAISSIVIGTGLSVALMVVFATGRFSPIIGALVQGLLNILVIAYALRAHNFSKSPI